MFRTRSIAVAVVALVAALLSPAVAGGDAIDDVTGTAASALPDPDVGWVATDFVRDVRSPVHRFRPAPGQVAPTDRIFPTVMRVDDKLAAPLDGHRWYMWVWRHGQYPRSAANGGRLVLLTANALSGPWTDRGFVTPANMSPTGWGPYSWTGGDVVWSDQYRKFFSFPHAYRTAGMEPYLSKGGGLDSFAMESPDGVNWTRLETGGPVLPAGPERYDVGETGYGHLLRAPGEGGGERWIWVYRAAYGTRRAANGSVYYSVAVATADDIHGPWVKHPANPVFDPYGDPGHNLHDGGDLMGVNAVVYHQGWYQMLWQDTLGWMFLSRSRDLVEWETLARYATDDVQTNGAHRAAPVFAPTTPDDVVASGGELVWDDQVGAWTLFSMGWDAANLAGRAGTVSVIMARSVTGGTELQQPPVAAASAPSTVVADADDGSASVALDGTGSRDPNGDALSYRWSGPFGSAGGAGPTVSLPHGRSTVGLVVHDGTYDSAARSVDVEVVKDTATLTCPADADVRGSLLGVQVRLAGTRGPAVGRPVELTASGGASAVATTDATGIAAAVLDLGDHGPSQVLTARFADDARYTGATCSWTVSWGRPAVPTLG